jgi:hypothetical protein
MSSPAPVGLETKLVWIMVTSIGADRDRRARTFAGEMDNVRPHMLLIV